MTGAPPLPESEADRCRWEVSAQRRRLLTGTWGPDALDREASFYDPSVREHLPPPELSRNPFLSLCLQVATLYDSPGQIVADDADEEEVERLVPETWWATMQERLKSQRGQNEALVRLDILGGAETAPELRRLAYRVVYADTVCDVVTDDEDPSRLLAVTELRPRRQPESGKWEWTWETFDIRNPAAPAFRIEAERQDSTGRTVRVDVTVEYAGSADYPYRDAGRPSDTEEADPGEAPEVEPEMVAGTPIMPYVLAHCRIGTHTWDPDTGIEIVSGTLTTAALWTMWVGGVRDNASPTRWVRDLNVLTQETSGGQLGISNRVVRHDPSTLLQLRSMANNQGGDIGQLPASMEPRTSAEAINLFVDGLGASWDISPDDIAPGSSGYALVLSRAGQRRARKRLEAPCRLADQIILATGARLLRGHGGATTLSTEPHDYQITYTEVERSPEEVKAIVDEVTMLRDAGLMTRRMALERVYPGLTPSQYEAIEEAIDEEKAAKTPPALAPGALPPRPPMPMPPDPRTPEPPGEMPADVEESE